MWQYDFNSDIAGNVKTIQFTEVISVFQMLFIFDIYLLSYSNGFFAIYSFSINCEVI